MYRAGLIAGKDNVAWGQSYAIQKSHWSAQYWQLEYPAYWNVMRLITDPKSITLPRWWKCV